MKLIIGLGNPGKKYEGTRHNAGFMFLDKLICNKDLAPAGECSTFLSNKKFEAEMVEVTRKGEKIILVKPQTYMNLSGNTVSMMMSYYKISVDDLIVVSDDVDLPVGQARIRHDGSSGGQKGLQNIIDTLGSDDFTRVRIGIGASGTLLSGEKRPHATGQLDTADFVLSKFSKKELGVIDEIIELTVGHVLPFIEKNQKIPAHSLSVLTGAIEE
ncbi:MAG: aminoacyl-tRNA hydrolase [bacterium]|nr:aminoacyl-tRNA hydrolase [bacterium]